MSIKLMNQAWEVKGLDPTTKLILMCLADHANEHDRTCWPAISTIANKCDVSRATVKRRMLQLEQYGLIRRRSRTGDSTLYFILPDGEIDGVVQSEPGSAVSQGRFTSEPGGGSTVEPLTTINRQEPSLPTSNARGARLPADWFPEPLPDEFVRKHGITQHIVQNEFEKFVDYWTAIPGAKGRKLDWQATWRTWLRKAMEYQPRSKPIHNQRKSAMRNTMDAIEEYFSNDRRETEAGNSDAPDRVAFFKR